MSSDTPRMTLTILCTHDGTADYRRGGRNNRLDFPNCRPCQHTGMRREHFLSCEWAKCRYHDFEITIEAMSKDGVSNRTFASSLLQAEASHDDDDEHGVASERLSSRTNFLHHFRFSTRMTE